MSLKQLKGQTILVTGANRGLGLAVAKILAETQAKVIFTARQDKNGEETLSELKQVNPHGSYHYIKVDVSQQDSYPSFEQKIKQYAPIDVLINNVGANWKERSMEKWQETYNCNVIGTKAFTELMIPYIKKGGRVVMVSSRAGLLSYQNDKDKEMVKNIKSYDDPIFQGGLHYTQKDLDNLPDMGTYKISKAILNKYIQLAAHNSKFTSKNIQINGNCPGWCRTDMGSAKAPRSAEEGAISILWNAYTTQNTNGGFFADGEALKYD